MAVNSFRLVVLAVASLFIWLFVFQDKGSLHSRRAPVNRPFTFVPAEWPTLGAPTGNSGYYSPAQGWSKMSYGQNFGTYPSMNFTSDASWNIAVNSDSYFVSGCPTNKAPFADTASCWWPCGATSKVRSGVTGANCLRDQDVSECKLAGARSISITFDDGPQPYTRDLIKILKANNIPATFFLVGAHMVQYPDIVRELYDNGFELGMHTWSHKALSTVSTDVIIAELMWNVKAFYDILGVIPKYVRPPTGDIDDRVRSIITQMGMTPVLWNVDTQDFTSSSDASVVPALATQFQNAVSETNMVNLPNGIVLLEHDSFAGGVTFFNDHVLPHVQKLKLTTVGVAKCTGDKSWMLYNGNQAATTPEPTVKVKQTGDSPSQANLAFKISKITIMLIVFVTVLVICK